LRSFFSSAPGRYNCRVIRQLYPHIIPFPFHDSAPEFDLSEIEALFSAAVQNQADKSGSRREAFEANPDKLQLVM